MRVGIVFDSMEVIWHGAYQQLFSGFAFHGHQWQLAPVSLDTDLRSLDDVPGMKKYKDSAKVRFLCKVCDEFRSMAPIIRILSFKAL